MAVIISRCSSYCPNFATAPASMPASRASGEVAGSFACIACRCLAALLAASKCVLVVSSIPMRRNKQRTQVRVLDFMNNVRHAYSSLSSLLLFLAAGVGIRPAAFHAIYPAVP